MTLRSGGQLIVDALAQHGAERVFCVPGESYLDVLDALYDSDISTIVCRHEGGAGYMAEAQGKLSGRPGIAMVTRGPGAANAFVGVHTAYQDAVPMILFIGLIPLPHRHREAFQEFDVRGWFGTTAKQVLVLDQASRAPEVVAAAYHAALSGRPGPVIVGLPEDVLVDKVEVPDVPPLPVSNGSISAKEIASLGRLLQEATSPLVVVGGTRWTAAASRRITAWAEEWSLPVAGDFRTYDLVDHDSPSYVGQLGYGRDDRLAQRLSDADLVITLGGALSDVPTDGFTLRQNRDAITVVVSPDPSLLGHFGAVKQQIVASPEAFADAVGGWHPTDEVSWKAWTNEARAQQREYGALPDPSTFAPEATVQMTAVMADLTPRLPEDAIVTFGAGNHAIWAQRFIRHHQPGTLLGPRNGSMGYGTAAAVSASLSHPDRLVVSIAGDGCFMMNAQELATAVQYGAAPMIIVMDNAQYGTIRAHQEQHYPGRVSGTQLKNPDFAAMARSFGAHGDAVRTNADIAPAIDRALEAVNERRIPALLHVIVDPMVLNP